VTQSFIPFHVPSIGDEEIREVVDTLRSGWLTTGPKTNQFEKEFSAYVRAPHALAVNSCTSALHLALAALGIQRGDEVITTPLTFCATVNAILHVGATPVLADVGDDLNIDPASIEARINARTRAIIPVHFAGLACEMDAIWATAERSGLSVVEDAAHAIGSHYRGQPIGSGQAAHGHRSQAVGFSFYATKNMTTGEGGMVTTADPHLMERMRILCLHGISKDAWNRYSEAGKWYYEVLESGFKYNLSDIQSAIGLHQLRKLESFIETRARYARLYRELLSGIEEIELPPDNSQNRHAWHLFVLRLKTEQLEINRNQFIDRLREMNVGTSVHFIPIPMHPYFQSLPTLHPSLCPRAMDVYPRLVSIPLYPAMSENDVEHVATSVKKIVQSSRKKLHRVEGAIA